MSNLPFMRKIYLIETRLNDRVVRIERFEADSCTDALKQAMSDVEDDGVAAWAWHIYSAGEMKAKPGISEH